MTDENVGSEQARTVVGRFVLGPEDLERAAADQGFAKLGWALMLPAVLILAALFWRLGPVGTAFFRTVFPPLVFMVGIWLYFRHQLKKANARSFESKSPADTRLELDSAGYATITGVSSTRGTWHALNGFHEGKSCFLLFPHPSRAVILPKRAFSEADVARVRDLLHTHVKRAPAPVSKARMRLIVALLIIGIGLVTAVFYSLSREEAAERDAGHSDRDGR